MRRDLRLDPVWFHCHGDNFWIPGSDRIGFSEDHGIEGGRDRERTFISMTPEGGINRE